MVYENLFRHSSYSWDEPNENQDERTALLINSDEINTVQINNPKPPSPRPAAKAAQTSWTQNFLNNTKNCPTCKGTGKVPKGKLFKVSFFKNYKLTLIFI